MSILNEAKNIQNSALGSELIWTFCQGYYENEGQKGIPLPIIFIVLPMIFHEKTRDEIKATNIKSGLRLFAYKFKDQKDMLLDIQSRLLKMREISTKSIEIGLLAKRIIIEPKTATCWALEGTPYPSSGMIEQMHKTSYKLGMWCSKLTINEVAAILKVSF